MKRLPIIGILKDEETKQLRHHGNVLVRMAYRGSMTSLIMPLSRNETVAGVAMADVVGLETDEATQATTTASTFVTQ